MRRRNHFAKDLESPLFRQKIRERPKVFIDPREYTTPGTTYWYDELEEEQENDS